jgi:cytochrome c-type biogenesis protein CcmH/NrfG
MKKFLVAVMFGFMAIAAQAEATFDQIQTLIEQHQYQAAASGLEGIIQNHPKSAKAFYAMAQAQAGLGNLEKAQKALNIATGLNPTLDFAPASSVASLKQAITPQVAKIETIEESHAFRNFVLFVMFAGFAAAMYFLYSVYARKQEEEQAERDAEFLREEKARAERREALEEYNRKAREREAAERAEAEAKEAALKAHKNYGHERFDPANPDKLKSVKQFKEEKLAEAMVAQARAEAAEAKARAERAEMDARLARSNASSGPAHTTVVNNSSNDMLTGVLIGNMMSGSHHDTTRIVEREVVRETPSYTPSPTQSVRETKSSSWDDDSSSSSSKSSSSWFSSSDSSSSSSWDSGSSSSDSGSSSSWD